MTQLPGKITIERTVLLAAMLLLVLIVSTERVAAQFAISPYVQLGPEYRVNKDSASCVLRWAAKADDSSSWQTEVATGDAWVTLPEPLCVEDPDLQLKLYSQRIANLTPGTKFRYRILRAKEEVFQAEANSPKSSGQRCKILVMGDCGSGSKSQRSLAALAQKRGEDLVLMPGDIVYENGRLSEYLTKFFPVYNATHNGQPLMRSIPFTPCPGNHDTSTEGGAESADLLTFPDGLAYFRVWSVPLNGPPLPARCGPHLQGTASQKDALLRSSGGAFPRSCNYSFNYGSVHVLCLDADDYIDWADQSLQRWVAADLEAAQNMPWRIVAFHHACFSSDRTHFQDQQMRLLVPIFQRTGVQFAFCGHSHSYQRSMPLRFEPNDLRTRSRDGFVYGHFHFDKLFDGVTKTKPDGIIYVITGGGGAPLTTDPVANNRQAWQPFTVVYRNDVHSFTECDVTDDQFSVRQVAEDGSTIDSFVVSK